jgi:hypothetical protein
VWQSVADKLISRILITDTSSLITLAVADSLDYLAVGGIPIIIPDAVYYEATFDVEKMGAASIIEWTQKNPHIVQIMPTNTFTDQIYWIEQGKKRRRNLGEKAALEIANESTLLGDGSQAFILTEDDAVLSGGFINSNQKRRIVVISTYDFLTALEAEQLINSADAVYALAADAGRLASRRRAEKERHEATIAAIQDIMQRQASQEKP